MNSRSTAGSALAKISPISPDQINKVLGQGKIAEIAAQAGISPEQMSQLLAQALPTLVDKLTPGGRLPTQG